jgi:succinate-semialdehyde dehydrogenase/glutarate-semialdehyde dehydrogenase
LRKMTFISSAFSSSPSGSSMPSLALREKTWFHTDLLIAGQWHRGGSTFAVTNPATGDVLAEVASSDLTLAQAAIDSAASAQASWADLPVKTRCGLLMRWHDLLIAHQADLAYLLTLEQGKPLAQAQGEILYSASFIEWFAEQAKRVHGEILPRFDVQREQWVLRQPVGVCAAITPWNFPLAMVTRKVAPALAAGCTVVLKPSELTPLTALAAGALALEAGIPPGVFNLIPTSASATPEVGRLLCESPKVKHLSFTGSTAVGRLLMAQSASTLKRLSLELGGNAPFIVFDDADLNAAVVGALHSKFRNSGQTCVSANRFYVQAGIYEAFVQALRAEMEKLQLGPGLTPDVQVGPLIEVKAVEKVQAHIADALAHGAKCLMGGDVLSEWGPCFVAPTLLTQVTADMRCFQEETFGPVAAVASFETEEEVLRWANQSPFGLAAYVYTQDMQRLFRLSHRLEYGMVGMNVGQFSSEYLPFGGMKQSGFGREGSVHGIDEYLDLKYVCVGS